MKEKINILNIRLLLVFFIVTILSACIPRYNDPRFNDHAFPIDEMSVLFDKDVSLFKEVQDKSYNIVLRYYDFHVIEYIEGGILSSYTLAISKDESTFYLLNYPEKFSLNNFNKIIKTEKYSVESELHAKLYLKFFSKLFLPETDLIDESIIDVKKIKKADMAIFNDFVEKYKAKIQFSKGFNQFTKSEFYTLNGGSLMYKWNVRFRNDGLIESLQVTVISLGHDYTVKEQIVIYDKKVDIVEKITIYDPTNEQ